MMVAAVVRGFLEHDFSGGALYSVFVPHDYDEGAPRPLLLFLHGAAETGLDGSAPLKVGLGPAIVRAGERFPFLVVFPQSQGGTWRAESADGRRAMAILEEVRRRYNVDAGRIHLTGISMGGFGTWSLAIRYPEQWASIVPVCGGGNPRQAWRIKHIPCWAFHGDRDEVVPVEATRLMVDALRAAGGRPRYTEFPGVGANSWDRAYATPELYTWLAANALPAAL